MKSRFFGGFLQPGPFHFVGLGGIGMSGLAELLLASGHQVSGSDLQDGPLLRRLEKMGARVEIGHHPSHLGDARVVVRSSAIPRSNAELQEAERREIRVIHRAELLADMMRQLVGIAVSGTHGKTTTTSMIVEVLQACGHDVSAVIGARLPRLGSNARLGAGPLFVAEADESDKSFLQLSPVVAVVTNIDFDHMDVYRDEQDLIESFAAFMNSVPFFGQVIACQQDPHLSRALKKVHRRVITYALEEQADLSARNIELGAFEARYDCYAADERLGRIELKVGGRHNVLNSLAAVAAGLFVESPFAAIAAGLGEFRGAERRLQWKGEEAGVAVIDDYAHHPTEIEVTLEACRRLGRRLLVVYQPHRFSRTKDLLTRMNACFEGAEVLYLLDVYPAGEAPIPGVDSDRLARQIEGHRRVEYVADRSRMVPLLRSASRPGDVILTMGAGDVWKIGEEFLAQNN